MGTNQTLPHLDKMVEELLKDIKKIESEGKAQISDKIMERLRGETIFLRKSYVNAKKDADHCTIDPNKCIDLELSELEDGISEDKISILKRGIFAIKGNSFGPFNPEEYFKSDIKILWLLKESYITKSSWISGDRGGHNQAFENRLWGKMEENDTLENLIEITQQTMSKISGKEYSQQDAMNKTCILEVNHFPGLYFKSWESDDAKLIEWAEINHGLISILIDFYDPTIIYFASTLELFDTNIEKFEDVHERFYNNDLKIFDDKICEWAYVYATDGQEKDMPVKKHPITDKKQIKCVGRNIKYLGESGRIYVQAYHPAYKDYSYTNPSKKDVLTRIDSDKVKEWLPSSVSPNKIDDMISETSDHS